MEIFWNTIAQYNENTWWAQIIITVAGVLLTALLYRKPTIRVKRSMKIYMVFLNGWIASVYYLMYCDTRSYHHVLAIFWGVIALIWLWDLFTGYTPFERNPKYRVLVGVLYAMPFLYPLLSWARGMEFPMMTTTVMPCSVAAFTIGLLLASATVPAIYLFFKNYVAQNLHKETKPGARLMNWFLILICIIIGVFLSIILFQEVGK